MKTRTLTAELEIPYLGFGTYLIANGEVAAAVHQAIVAGYRHIDTAEGYQNESGVGEGIRQALESENLARGDLFVTTKLWPGNPAWGQPAKTTESTVTSLEGSLERLGLNYVDLYLIHAPYDRDQRLAQWRGLVELKRQGKARAIGVSNFGIKHIEELKVAGLPVPVANQIDADIFGFEIDDADMAAIEGWTAATASPGRSAIPPRLPEQRGRQLQRSALMRLEPRE